MAAISHANAVGYVRMSSDKQDKSPEQQREHILKLADRLKYRIIRWYEDLGVSGDDIRKRSAFRRMVADATKRNDFEVILCWSQDRFGRFDSIEAGEWVAPLRRAGVRLATATEGEISWTDGPGRLVYTIQQEGKHTVLLDMARTSARGRVQAVMQAGFVGGRVPYGYERIIQDDRGKVRARLSRMDKFRKPRDWKCLLVVSREVAEVKAVRWMFRAYCRGMSLDSMSYRLNGDRVPTARGGLWSSRTVRNILENPVYVGDQVWNRRHVGKYFAIMGGEVATDNAWALERGGRQTLWSNNPATEWLVVPNAHPAIVSRKLFDRAQARLQTRLGRAYQRPGLPLTGLVKCGHCGKRMSYHPYKAAYGGERQVYYRISCKSRGKYGPSVCTSRMVKEPWLLGVIVKLIQECVLDSTVEARLRQRLSEELINQRQDPAEVKRQQVQIEMLDQQIERGLDNLLKAPPKLVAAACKRIALWQAHRDEIKRRIDAHKQSSSKAISDAIAEVMAEIRSLRVGIATDERALLHHTLQRLVGGLTLWFEPNPNSPKNSPKQSQFARGVLVTRCPFVHGRTVQQEFEFHRDDVNSASPRWHAKRLGTKEGGNCQVVWLRNGRAFVDPDRVPLPESRF